MLEADIQNASALAALLDAEVPRDWPPGEYDRQAIEFLLKQTRSLESAAEGDLGWLSWYAVCNANAGRPAALVGAAGYFGPPDAGHCVEIGFSVAQEWRRRGFATEIVMALVKRAIESRRVRTVRAHTRSDNDASIRVLQKCGFVPVPSDDPELLLFEHRSETG